MTAPAVETDKPVLIVNPRSGGGLSRRAWAKLVGPLTDGLGAFEVRFTEKPGDGRRLAYEAAAAQRTLVVAMGGDGTISEVAGGILSAGGASALGIIPRGTGGDFVRSLGLPADIVAAAVRARTGRPRRIDAARVILTGADGASQTSHFINVASFGFSGDVARRANASSKRLGAKASFLGATVKSLLVFENADISLSLDGAPPRRLTALLVAIGNGRYFGGGMRICPDAQLDDGLLEVVTVGDLGRLEMLTKLPRLYQGTHLSLAEVRHARAHTIEVTPATPGARIPLEIDGETSGHLPAKFEVLPQSLTLRL